MSCVYGFPIKPGYCSSICLTSCQNLCTEGLVYVNSVTSNLITKDLCKSGKFYEVDYCSDKKTPSDVQSYKFGIISCQYASNSDHCYWNNNSCSNVCIMIKQSNGSLQHWRDGHWPRFWCNAQIDDSSDKKVWTHTVKLQGQSPFCIIPRHYRLFKIFIGTWTFISHYHHLLCRMCTNYMNVSVCPSEIMEP